MTPIVVLTVGIVIGAVIMIVIGAFMCVAEDRKAAEAPKTRQNADNDMLFARIKRFERICMDHGERISRCQRDIDSLREAKNPTEARKTRKEAENG